MLFDSADAALALQSQDFMQSVPHPADADRAGPMLDAALLAETNPAPPAETEIAAIMAALGEEMGEMLVASPTEMMVAPFEAAVLEGSETNPVSIDFELASTDLVLPPPGEELPANSFADSSSTQSAEPIIVVTGTRVRLYYVPAEEPSMPPPVEPDTLQPPSLEPIESNPDAGHFVYEILPLGLKLKIPEAEWNALSQTQKNALFHVLENYKKSPDLEAALLHLKNEGVEVVLRFGERSWNAMTGLSYDFGTNVWAGMTADPLNNDRTDLRAGSLVVISFNSNHSGPESFDGFGSTLVHELLHPWVPNTWQLVDGLWGWHDHDRIEGPEGMEAEAWKRIIAP
jgi:hypothetical protein